MVVKRNVCAAQSSFNLGKLLTLLDDRQKKEIENHKKQHPQEYEDADPTGDLVRKNEGNDRSKPGRINRWMTMAMEQLSKII